MAPCFEICGRSLFEFKQLLRLKQQAMVSMICELFRPFDTQETASVSVQSIHR